MFIFYFLCVSFCEVFEWRNSNNKKTLVFDVTGDQICKGHFKPLPGSNSSFKVIIRSEKNSIFFQNDNLPMNVETHYSFNVTDNEDLICEMTPVDVEKQRGFQSELEIRFETQFDTFRKEVAKEVRVEPAMYSLTKLENLLHEISKQTEELATQIGDVEGEHKRIFVFANILSILTLIVYILVQGYLFYSMKDFLKNKKFI
ncbi:Putative membrane integral protein [Nosema bombycis CQ1]|uniref:Putative membrane integral protein n=1 Tax=Nosema bombycis (strain CQ1 / CVCC 102059) TaxID=578461 RepID=R0MMQ7_NOSB1|nr:Putative membrane integral protein [Nosema bombycis CQ1]EOB14164.1 Putative membrane integral protein [Nosema bombycis CQ1]|eukprot:EOB14158.1 Putative membrane integral protein [Nosema bombycis CQ1]